MFWILHSLAFMVPYVVSGLCTLCFSFSVTNSQRHLKGQSHLQSPLSILTVLLKREKLQLSAKHFSLFCINDFGFSSPRPSSIWIVDIPVQNDNFVWNNNIFVLADFCAARGFSKKRTRRDECRGFKWRGLSIFLRITKLLQNIPRMLSNSSWKTVPNFPLNVGAIWNHYVPPQLAFIPGQIDDVRQQE